jgi:methyltransferase family protein
MACNVCSAPLSPFARATVLGRHAVEYSFCDTCESVQTEAPYWLEEAYGEAITASDLGLLERNLALARITEAVILALFDGNRPFLDYGGGYGLFTRRMRDRGFDFHTYDRHCPNLFARGFEARPDTGGRYELVTAFEVVEHLWQPLPEMEEMLRLSDNLLLGTRLLPARRPKPGQWWYYGLEHGQHVRVFSRRTLALLAERWGRRLYSDGHAFHLLTTRRCPDALFRALTRPGVAAAAGWALRWRLRTPSHLPEDYRKRTGMSLR